MVVMSDADKRYVARAAAALRRVPVQAWEVEVTKCPYRSWDGPADIEYKTTLGRREVSLAFHGIHFTVYDEGSEFCAHHVGGATHALRVKKRGTEERVLYGENYRYSFDPVRDLFMEIHGNVTQAGLEDDPVKKIK